MKTATSGSAYASVAGPKRATMRLAAAEAAAPASAVGTTAAGNRKRNSGRLTLRALASAPVRAPATAAAPPWASSRTSPSGASAAHARSGSGKDSHTRTPEASPPTRARAHVSMRGASAPRRARSMGRSTLGRPVLPSEEPHGLGSGGPSGSAIERALLVTDGEEGRASGGRDLRVGEPER